MLLIYTTHPTQEHAEKIVQVLLQKKLIACANIFPITSSYRWQGEVKHEEEVVAILKTTEKHWDKVRKTIEELHEYEVPCVLKLPVEGNAAFRAWVERETT